MVGSPLRWKASSLFFFFANPAKSMVTAFRKALKTPQAPLVAFLWFLPMRSLCGKVAGEVTLSNRDSIRSESLWKASMQKVPHSDWTRFKVAKSSLLSACVSVCEERSDPIQTRISSQEQVWSS
jgi:hypothetical protein